MIQIFNNHLSNYQDNFDMSSVYDQSNKNQDNKLPQIINTNKKLNDMMNSNKEKKAAQLLKNYQILNTNEIFIIKAKLAVK